jgi:hypothetical protein
LAAEFVLLRLTDIRGVNLDLFDFDFDLTWAGFFLSPNEDVYGRYGGRDPSSPDNRMSLSGLRYAMTKALRLHQSTLHHLNSKIEIPKLEDHDTNRSLRISNLGLGTSSPTTFDQFPGARRRPSNSCIHCHQVYDFRRESRQSEGKWRLDEIWVYPLPENIGLTLDVDQGDRIQRVAENSPASRAGLQARDRLESINGMSVASIADVQYGLHRAPAEGKIPISWLRAGESRSGRLTLPMGWRKTDISWRWSLRGLEPSPWVQGEDLTPVEKKQIGLSESQLAFYQAAFVSETARQAGIRPNDIIMGVDDKPLRMTAREFQAYIRLNYKVGDQLNYNIVRDGQRLKVPLKLISRPRDP